MTAAVFMAHGYSASADEPAAIPKIVNGTLSIAFQHGVKAGTTITTSDGITKSATKVSADSGGFTLTPLDAAPQFVETSLEKGRTIDIVLTGPKSDAEWKIEPIINFLSPSPPFLPVHFDGGQDTTGTGTLTALTKGAHAAITFTAQKNNYVQFTMDQPLPADTVGLGGIAKDDPASPVTGLLSVRVADSTGEIFGYSFHGSGIDDYTTPQSTSLAAIRYRFGGAPSSDGKPKTGAPIGPLKIVGLLVEPGKWQWAGSMTTNITEIYAIRQIRSEIASIPPSVVVMLDKPVPNNKSMCGFIGEGEAVGSTERMTALRPALWRIGNHPEPDRTTLKAMGVPIIVVLSDLWGYKHSNAPSLDWGKYEAAMAVDAKGWQSFNPIMEPWNEPDNTGDQFGPSNDIRDFYAIYNHAYHAVRNALGPNVPVEGPSYAMYTRAKIKGFLDYCVANNLEVNYLSWHELDKDSNPAMIVKDVVEVRHLLATNPKYHALKISKIQINETVGQSVQYKPGDITAYLYYLEKSGVDGACKGCWWAVNGQMNCFNRSIDGILDPMTNGTRSAFWAYKLYSDGVSHRVLSTASDLRLAPIASDANGGMQLLLGNHFVGSQPLVMDAPVLTIEGVSSAPSLRARKSLTISVSRLPDSGEAVLNAPVVVATLTAKVTANTATFTLPTIGPHEALVVKTIPG